MHICRLLPFFECVTLFSVVGKKEAALEDVVEGLGDIEKKESGKAETPEQKEMGKE